MARLPWRRGPAALFLLGLLAALPGQGESKQLVVCAAADTQPLSRCEEAGNATDFTGYDVEIFRSAAQLLDPPLVEGEGYVFRCLSFDAILSDLLAPSGACDVGLGAVTVTTEREAAGILFSYPSYPSSLGVLVPAKISPSDGWFFTRPFSWQVWLAIGLSLLLFPLLSFVVEALALKGRVRHEDWRPGLRNAYWEVSWLSMQNGSSSVQSSATRIMLLGYGVMALVLLSLYSAQLTAFLTISKIKTSVQSITDLRGRAVGSLEVYRERLERNAILPVTYQWQGMQALGRGGPNDWLTALEVGTLAAFVLDEPILQYLDRSTGCDLRMLPETFEPFDYAMAFRNGTPPDFLRSIDTAILTLQEDGTMAQLREQFIVFPQPVCSLDDSSSSNGDAAVQFSQIWGVWVVFAGSVAVGLLVAAVLIQRRKKTLRRRETSRLEEAARQLEEATEGKPSRGRQQAAAAVALDAIHLRHLTAREPPWSVGAASAAAGAVAGGASESGGLSRSALEHVLVEQVRLMVDQLLPLMQAQGQARPV